MKKLVILSIAFVLVFGSFVSSATYYANPTTGDDAATGASGDPWKNIGPHLFGGPNVMSAGDTLILTDGTYNETPNALNGLYTLLGGITIQGENKGGALVFFNSSFQRGFYPDDASISLIGFNMSTNDFTCDGILIRDASFNMTIENLTISDFEYAIITNFDTGQGTNISIKNNLFENNSYIIYNSKTNFINSTFYNNTIQGTELFEMNGSVDNYGITALDVKDNIFNCSISVTGSNSLDVLVNNTLIPTALTLRNVTSPSFLNLTNLSFIHNNELISATQRYIYFVNSSNINLFNISFCSADSFCIYNNVENATYMVVADAYSENITVENSSFYIQGDKNIRVLDIRGNRMYARNNTIIHNGTGGGWGILADGNYSSIENNVVYIYNNSLSYTVGLGSEGRSAWYVNASITDNVIKSFASLSGATHMVFLGYMENSLVENNVVVGGGYNYVIKGNKNTTVRNNFGNETSNIGIYEKAGENNTFENNEIYANATADSLIYIADNGASFNATNSTWISNRVHCLSGSTNCVFLSTGAKNIYFYNTTVDNESISVSESTTFLERYWPLEISGDSGISFSLVDNQSNSYDGYSTDTYTTTYFFGYNKTSSSQTNYTPYILTASKYGCTSSVQTIYLNMSRSVTLSLDCPTSTTTSGGEVQLIPHLILV